ncbi:anti-sigma factor RsiW [Paraburkholderia sp. BL23I1N1]|uniref:anti-sigma factor family protein n=1 Tax=Paraburkholderia sp. BL23I1N1 TaxID=1938802 RepID=UPI000E74BE76|nr:zf-HC2 domain-containing protein [Paraburkholderia sp. BL23I1N1]RKE35789.1 anti-sigma factor RsiW [Paraburkholderia sp. BL23I1N1]
MDCNEARPLLDANADHELPAPDAQRVQQHIESCDACRRESENRHVLSESLRAAPYHRAPDSLRARIVAGLPGTGDAVATTQAPAGAAVQPQPPRQRRRLAWIDRFNNWLNGRRGPQGGFGGPGVAVGSNRLIAQGWLAALVVALCAVAAGVTLNLRRPAEFGPFADELVESHVRAQVSGRDIDVISTDKHTVKPWFNGRLDYSPPVEDLAASGFALEGGRLDYLAHQRVAVLVYRYRKHVIDVYVFPEAGSGGTGRGTDGAAPATLAREGYSISHWNGEGMTWWAITDAAPDALSGLETALKARLQGGSERTEGG